MKKHTLKEKTKSKRLKKKSLLIDKNTQTYANNNNNLYVVELSDEEIKIIDQKELDKWYKSTEEFDGILGFTIRGKLIK